MAETKVNRAAQESDARVLPRLLNAAIAGFPALFVIHSARQYVIDNVILHILWTCALVGCAVMLLIVVSRAMTLLEGNENPLHVLRRSSRVVWSLLLQASMLALIPQREIKELDPIEHVGSFRGMSTRRSHPIMEISTPEGVATLNIDQEFVNRLGAYAPGTQVSVWEFDSYAVSCVSDDGVVWSLQEYNAYHKWTGWRFSVVVMLILMGYLLLARSRNIADADVA